MTPRALVAVLCGVAISSARPSLADAPKRHELAVAGLAGYAITGYDAQLLGELAICGSTLDVVGRLGARFTYTSWDAPLGHVYPEDLPLGMAFLTLGARWKL
jgi:hypothetical protein